MYVPLLIDGLTTPVDADTLALNVLVVSVGEKEAVSFPTVTCIEPVVAIKDADGTNPVEYAGNVEFSLDANTPICDFTINASIVTSSIYSISFESDPVK